MKIKLDKADIAFSWYIRTRDQWTCQRCGRKEEPTFENKSSLQCSHYFGRARESTRFDTENCDTLCYGCHQYWGSTNREDYRHFKVKQLGEKGFTLLEIRSNTYKGKDRKMEYIIAKELLKTLPDWHRYKYFIKI